MQNDTIFNTISEVTKGVTIDYRSAINTWLGC
jgi:hypothetical protein